MFGICINSSLVFSSIKLHELYVCVCAQTVISSSAICCSSWPVFRRLSDAFVRFMLWKGCNIVDCSMGWLGHWVPAALLTAVGGCLLTVWGGMLGCLHPPPCSNRSAFRATPSSGVDLIPCARPSGTALSAILNARMPWRRHLRKNAARRATIYAAWALVCAAMATKALPLLWRHVRQRDQELAVARGVQMLLAAALVRLTIKHASHAADHAASRQAAMALTLTFRKPWLAVLTTGLHLPCCSGL